MGAGTTAAGGPSLPMGTVASLWFRVEEGVERGSGLSALPGETRFGTALRVLFTPSSPGRDVAWEPATWYQLRNLVHAPSRSQRCPDCGTALAAADDAVDEAITLARDRGAAPQLVGTDAFEATPLGATGWLTPVAGFDVDPIRWTCRSCGYVSGTADERGSHAGRSETLSGRVHAALAGVSASPPGDAGETDSRSTATESFRTRIRRGTRPAADEVTLAAVRSAYEFDATVPDPTVVSSLSPTVAGAVSTNPVTGTVERFCEIALNARTFDWSRQRPSLDLVFAIDISGSMAAPFESSTDAAATASKLAAVREALTAVVQRLDSSDRLGVVLFDTTASVARPLRPVVGTTHERLRTHLAGVAPAGNTNSMAGLCRAGDLFDDATGRPDTERRVVLVSDTVPTAGGASTEQYLDRCGEYRRRGIGASFVGLGFHDVTRTLCREPGTNVAVAGDPAALTTLCRRHFDSVLFPVAFDLTIETCPGTELVDVAAASDPSTDGGTVHRTTVFPAGPTAQSLDGVLLQLSDATESADVRVTWTDRRGERHERSLSVAYDQRPGTWFDTDSVRVAVALHRYLRTLQAWCRGEGAAGSQSTRVDRLREYLLAERAATGVAQFDADIEVLRAITGD